MASSQMHVSENLSQNVSLGMETKSAFSGHNTHNLPSSGNLFML